MQKKPAPFSLLIISLSLTVGACADSPSNPSSSDRESALSAIGTPANPERSVSSYAVESDGSSVFLGSGAAVLVLDAADPADLRLQARIELPGIVRDLSLEGPLLGAACGDAGLALIDVSRASVPLLLSREPLDDRAEGVAVVAGKAFVAARSAGVLVFDVTDPGRPEEIGRFETDEQAIDVVASGDLLFVAASFGGLRVLDVSDPTVLREVGFADRGAYDMGRAVGVAAQGEHAYVANHEIGLRVVNVSVPEEPKTNSIYPLLHAPVAVTVEGRHVFVADQDAGIHVVDVSDPVRPKGAATLRLSGRAMDLVLEGTTAFVAAGEGGLWAVDVRDPNQPRTIGSYIVGESVSGVDALGGVVALADTLRGVRLLELSQGGDARELSSIPGSASHVAVGNGLLAAVLDGRLGVFELSNREKPSLAGEIPVRAEVRDLEWIGDDLLLVASEWFLELVQLSSASSPRTVGSLTAEEVCGPLNSGDSLLSSPAFDSSFWDVAGDSTAVYAGCDGGLARIDFGDRGAPRVRSRLKTRERVAHIELDGNLAFLSCDDGLRIVDASDPSTLREVGYFDSPGFLRGSARAGDTLYVIDLQAGLLVLDISEPASTREEMRLELSHRPLALKFQSPLLLIATGSGGLEVFDVSELNSEN